MTHTLMRDDIIHTGKNNIVFNILNRAIDLVSIIPYLWIICNVKFLSLCHFYSSIIQSKISIKNLYRISKKIVLRYMSRSSYYSYRKKPSVLNLRFQFSFINKKSKDFHMKIFSRYSLDIIPIIANT